MAQSVAVRKKKSLQPFRVAHRNILVVKYKYWTNVFSSHLYFRPSVVTIIREIWGPFELTDSRDGDNNNQNLD